jgi:hypothetical protein
MSFEKTNPNLKKCCGFNGLPGFSANWKNEANLLERPRAVFLQNEANSWKPCKATRITSPWTKRKNEAISDPDLRDHVG